MCPDRKSKSITTIIILTYLKILNCSNLIEYLFGITPIINTFIIRETATTFTTISIVFIDKLYDNATKFTFVFTCSFVNINYRELPIGFRQWVSCFIVLVTLDSTSVNSDSSYRTKHYLC